MCVGQWVSQWVAPGASVTSGSVISPVAQPSSVTTLSGGQWPTYQLGFEHQ